MVRIVLYICMRRDQQTPQPSQNQHFQEISNLLILHDIKSIRINTSKKSANLRIIFIPIDFKPTRINTSGNKDLKSPRINTSGHKDLKSNHFNTSKKQGRGEGCPLIAVDPTTIRSFRPRPPPPPRFPAPGAPPPPAPPRANPRPRRS